MQLIDSGPQTANMYHAEPNHLPEPVTSNLQPVNQ